MVLSPGGGLATVGRFGWKANAANLVSQNAAAALDDIGITNVIFSDENCMTVRRACNSAVSHEGVEMPLETLELLTVYTRSILRPVLLYSRTLRFFSLQQQGTDDHGKEKQD
jgi:CxxC motif-containing protein (DUF1111 family)